MKLAILNITSWVGISAPAEHVYGTIYLVDNDKITTDNVTEFSIQYITNDKFELRQPITMEMAVELDKKDSSTHYVNMVKVLEDDPTDTEMIKWCTTNRFNTVEEITEFGFTFVKEMKFVGIFISLFNGNKFKKTIIKEL